jgi:hypothetical protein
MTTLSSVPKKAVEVIHPRNERPTLGALTEAIRLSFFIVFSLWSAQRCQSL